MIYNGEGKINIIFVYGTQRMENTAAIPGYRNNSVSDLKVFWPRADMLSEYAWNDNDGKTNRRNILEELRKFMLVMVMVLDGKFTKPMREGFLVMLHEIQIKN